MTPEIIIAALSAVGGGVLVAIVNAFANRKKVAAEADNTEALATSNLSDSAIRLVSSMEHRIDKLTAANDDCVKRAEKFHDELEGIRSRYQEMLTKTTALQLQIEAQDREIGRNKDTIKAMTSTIEKLTRAVQICEENHGGTPTVVKSAQIDVQKGTVTVAS